MSPEFDIVILGLSVTSSWGNGHATTYRGLIQGLAARGHRILFLERDQPWYAGNRDEPHPRGATTILYESFEELVTGYEAAVSHAKLVIVGSFVPEGAEIGEWVTSVARGVTAFYDIDTPVTLAQLAAGDSAYVKPALIPRYHMYLSFTGGPALSFIESRYGAPMARVLYCSVDPALYRPERSPYRWELGYLGTYSDDRQPVLDALLLEPARRRPKQRFAVVGPMYPKEIRWPANVDREIHLSPREHPRFYGGQRFTLNVTRAAMKEVGHSPSVRLFEAGACGVPVISDWWPGLETLFRPGREVLIAESPEDVLRHLSELDGMKRLAIGEAARRKVLAEHTPKQRALQLEAYWKEANDHISAGAARRNGRRRKVDHGLDAGVEAKREGARRGEGSRGGSGETADPGRVHQSAGARG
jgi:spore maturation protein CgeB